MPSEVKQKVFLTGPQVDKRYNHCNRTRKRWVRDPVLEFPAPMIVNNREFYDLELLEAWERKRAAATAGG